MRTMLTYYSVYTAMKEHTIKFFSCKHIQNIKFPKCGIALIRMHIGSNLCHGLMKII